VKDARDEQIKSGFMRDVWSVVGLRGDTHFGDAAEHNLQLVFDSGEEEGNIRSEKQRRGGEFRGGQTGSSKPDASTTHRVRQCRRSCSGRCLSLRCGVSFHFLLSKKKRPGMEMLWSSRSDVRVGRSAPDWLGAKAALQFPASPRAPRGFSRAQ
jgi:hypothetical protein